MSQIPLWGGVECTVNRVGNVWHDQMQLSGHAGRIQDLELIGELGIRTLRYPVLWERVAPVCPQARDWRWCDERLEKLQALSITPIIGLLHHGSGPGYTGLLHENFPAEFAQYAAAVAARYPWVKQYTPINEPMTTARFSGLYGHWYPHHRNNRSFVRAFINQCRATVLAMAAIRKINPAAELVQTEDLGTTYSTQHLEYQRSFDNERRWLTWDILCGCVDRHHNLRCFLESCGISAEELDSFTRDPCPPQIIGINHYVTSDRFLDERTPLYPASSRGGNAMESYSDVDAVRVLSGDYKGWQIIQAAALRYGLPVALTEVHIGCTREEQVRWFNQAYSAAQAAQRAGFDVRGVTAWSLFGAYNWDKLLTRTDGSYEPGAFDVRVTPPRATAVAKLIRLHNSAHIRDDALERQVGAIGWWQRPGKILYGTPTKGSFVHAGRTPRPLLICGAHGVLGHAFVEECEKRGLPCVALSRSDLNIADPAAVDRRCAETSPWGIINAAGYVRVDQAEQSIAECYRDNFDGARVLAAAAAERNIPLLTFSSDLVFDGKLACPYTESSPTAPLNVYGMSKLASEAATMRYPRTLCVRTAAFFGAENGSDFLAGALMSLSRGAPYSAIEDVTVSPTYIPDLASAALDLLMDDCTGLVHLVNQGAATWVNFLEMAAAEVGVSTRSLRRSSVKALDLPARRPAYSALHSERVRVMPSLANAISRYARAYRESHEERAMAMGSR